MNVPSGFGGINEISTGLSINMVTTARKLGMNARNYNGMLNAVAIEVTMMSVGVIMAVPMVTADTTTAAEITEARRLILVTAMAQRWGNVIGKEAKRTDLRRTILTRMRTTDTNEPTGKRESTKVSIERRFCAGMPRVMAIDAEAKLIEPNPQQNAAGIPRQTRGTSGVGGGKV